MKKIISTLVVFSIILAIIYSGWWYYYSGKIKLYSSDYLLNLSQKFGGADSDFNYANVSVSGFPFGFNISVDGAKFIFGDKDLSSDILFEENIAIYSNILGTKYEVILPVNVEIYDKISNKRYAIKYKNPPRIVIQYGIVDITNWFSRVMSGDEKDKLFFVKNIKYYDNGYNIKAEKETSDLISSGSNYIDVGFSDIYNYHVKLNLKDTYLHYLDGEHYNIDNNKYDIIVDVAVEKVNQETKTLINQLEILSQITSMSIKGDMTGNAVEALPSGNLQIKINNYEEFVDFQGGFINYIVKKSAFPLFSIQSEQVNKFKKFLNVVASEKYNDGRDILVLVRRDSGAFINIGEYNFYEALQVYKTGEPVERGVLTSESVDRVNNSE